MGDGLLALSPRRADDALLAALALHEAANEYSRARLAAGQPRLEVGIGLHWGTAIVGAMGDEGRLDGTVISEAVNTASRLESLTRNLGSDTLASEQFVRRLRGVEAYQHRYLGRLRLRSKNGQTAVYEFISGDPEPGTNVHPPGPPEGGVH